MLRRLNVLIDRRPLVAPFRISRGIRHVADLLVVELVQDGIVARGEGVPIARYGATVESGIAEIERLRPALEDGLTRSELMLAMPAGAARNALDCALWDLEARLAGRSVASLVGALQPDAIITARTVGVDTPVAMARAAAAFAGLPLVKVKVDSNNPGEQLRAVRQAAPMPRLIVDANEAWSVELLSSMLPVLSELRVDLLEQPLPAANDAALEDVRSDTPICADESCHIAADVKKLASRYQAVNIKLDKTGGLTAALELHAAARKEGMGVMTGCMICSSLSIAPAFLLAPQSDFADLDGPLWLAEDHEGGVTLDGGVLRAAAPKLWGAG